MRLPQFLGRAADILDRYKLFLIIASVIVFISFRILKRMGAFSFLDWLGQSQMFVPGLIESVAFAASMGFLFLAYRYSPRLEGARSLGVIFLAGLFIVAGFTMISQPKWNDAQGYHNLGVYGAENGPLELIRDYHRINTAWPEETVMVYDEELSRYGLLEWGKEVLRYEVGEPGSGASRIQLHPPLWPVVLSIGILVFGVSELSSLIITWIVFALIPVVFFLIISRTTERKWALRISFLSMLFPVMLLSNNEPVMDGMVTLLVLASFYFISGKDHSLRGFALSGLLISLAFFTKMTVAFIFPLFLVLILVRHGTKPGMKRVGVFLLPAVLVALVFMSQGYYFFLTAITAKASMAARLDAVVKNNLVTYGIIPVYYMVYFGFPVLVLLAIEFLRDLSGKIGRESAMRMLPVAFMIGFMFLYPNKLGLERLVMPFLFIVLAQYAGMLSRHISTEKTLLLTTLLLIFQSLGFLI